MKDWRDDRIGSAINGTVITELPGEFVAFGDIQFLTGCLIA